MKRKIYSFRIKEVIYQYLDSESNIQSNKFYTLAVKEKFLGIFPVWREFTWAYIPNNPTTQFESKEDAMKGAIEYVKREEKKWERKIKEKQLKTTAKAVSNFNLDGDGEVL